MTLKPSVPLDVLECVDLECALYGSSSVETFVVMINAKNITAELLQICMVLRVSG